MKTTAPRDLYERLQRGETLNLLDVRTPAGHAEVHVPGVKLAPLEQLDAGEILRNTDFTKDQSEQAAGESCRRTIMGWSPPKGGMQKMLKHTNLREHYENGNRTSRH